MLCFGLLQIWLEDSGIFRKVELICGSYSATIWLGVAGLCRKRVKGISVPNASERGMEGRACGMHEDVVWANGMEDGHVYGRAGVRDSHMRI
jgi:hypothetical protein